jgi:hypothetical protein
MAKEGEPKAGPFKERGWVRNAYKERRKEVAKIGI